MNIRNSEIHALQLDGFLNAVRCLVGHPSKKFGACLLEKAGRSIEDLIEEHTKNTEITNTKIEGFKYIQGLFKERIYSKLGTNTNEILDNLDWNLIEYYGLISTAENEDGPWNRLVSQESYILSFVYSDKNDGVIIFTEYEEFVLVTYL